MRKEVLQIRDQNKASHIAKGTLYYFAGLLIVIMFLIPFIWMFFLSFKDNFGIFADPFGMPESLNFALYAESFKTAKILQMLLNSLIVTTIAVGIAMILVFMSSYSIARLVKKGRRLNNIIYYLFLAGSAIPIFGQLMSIYKITNTLGEWISWLGIGSKWSLILPYVALQIPMITLVLVGGLRSVPTALEEAAIIDGCGLLQMMFRIVLPTIKPVFFTALIINYLSIWNEFPIANILLNNQNEYTVPMATLMFKNNYTSDYGGMLRAAIMLMIPQFIFYLIFQKNIVEGMATAGIKG